MKNFFFAVILLSCVHLQAINFKKVVIWGHKLHTHTHSYVHNAFFLAFQHLGYPTYWFDEHDNVKDFDFSDSLFVTEWQVEKGMPLRSDCYYILHNCDYNKYKTLFDNGHAVHLRVYRKDRLAGYPQAINIEPFIYWDVPSRMLFMPWATDLLPHQIDAIKEKVPSIKKERDTIYWVGTLGGSGIGENMKNMTGFIQACHEQHIKFLQRGPSGVSFEDHIDYIQRSYMAPTIVGTLQKEIGYIPCRIFKNISYGQMGITNSREVYELFNKKIVYNSDSYQLFFDAQKALANVTLDDIYELMDFVKTKHTYLNRIATLNNFFDEIAQSL